MILYFSGCGNSAFVARRLSASLGDTVVIRLFGDVLLNAEISAEANDRIVWVFPVYSWGVPPVVADFIKRVKIMSAGSVGHHLILTCGDDAGLADKQWRVIVRNRGWKAMSASTVIMPNTYTLKKGFDVDSKSLADAKLQDSLLRIERLARCISEDSDRVDVVRGRFAWIKSSIVYPWFVRFAMSPKPFHYTEDCISCGKCAKVCPMRNILMDGKHPRWNSNCALCLACYNVCPAHAVAYGKATLDKGQYFLDD